MISRQSVEARSDHSSGSILSLRENQFPTLHLVGIGVGYRAIEVDGVVDNIEMDLDFKGFFGTVVLRF